MRISLLDLLVCLHVLEHYKTFVGVESTYQTNKSSGKKYSETNKQNRNL